MEGVCVGGGWGGWVGVGVGWGGGVVSNWKESETKAYLLAYFIVGNFCDDLISRFLKGDTFRHLIFAILENWFKQSHLIFAILCKLFNKDSITGPES